MGQQMTRTIMQTISEKTLGSEKCVTEARRVYRRACNGPPSIFIVQYVTGFVVGLIGPVFPPFMALTVLVGCSRRKSACGSRGLGDGSNKHFCILYTQMPCLPLLCPCKLCRWLSTSRSCWGDPNPQNTMLICPRS